MKSENQPHILNAASNLLGICFVLITGLKIAKSDQSTLTDEITMFAALSFLGSCVVSYVAMRSNREARSYERAADAMFLLGLLALFFAVVIFAMGLF